MASQKFIDAIANSAMIANRLLGDRRQSVSQQRGTLAHLMKNWLNPHNPDSACLLKYCQL
ncbi:MULTISPECIES: hypothetical protein [unclassified Moorena]|uniref:hypothetical protein n=1 Tax=unclassified Moorena TaxID=2683338 RepID=UPI0014008DDF|nr:MULTISPECIES: hypothetical protein [unclassified Moorena]NEO17417.1 hypothetical protein [Moorena sp. SIO3E8]NEQ04076.1 hypothetical protein [Moorena sp. SIO3F7]